MFNPNPEMLVLGKKAMEQYYRQEGIPAKDVPDLMSNDEDVLVGVRRLMQAVRRALTMRKTVGVRLLATWGDR